MVSSKKDKRIVKTIVATLLLLIVFFTQGAVVVIGEIEGVSSLLIRGGIIGAFVILTLCFFLLKYKSLSVPGFGRMRKGTAKRLLFFIPLFIIAFSHFSAGIDSEVGISLLLANIFFTLSIGMAEEIYFRGIICNMWLEKGIVKAMIISAVLFGLCHILNIAGGAGVIATVMQICFAFIYGMVFALLFAIGKSIVPCVLLHALHDFCSFVSADASLTFNIVLGSIQFVILAVYLVFLLVQVHCEKDIF